MELTTVSDNAYANIMGAAQSMRGGEADILKFSKGKWLLGQDAERIDVGTRFAINMMDARWGWLRWRDGKPEERRMVTYASGQSPDPRSELGDNEKDMWERDDRDQPRDPWQKTFEIPGRLETGGEDIVISGSSAGMEGAVKRLLMDFGKEYRMHMGKTPVIALGESSYKHRNPQYGMIDVPVLEIVDWKTTEELEEGAEAPPKKAKKTAKF